MTGPALFLAPMLAHLGASLGVRLACWAAAAAAGITRAKSGDFDQIR